MVKSQQRLPFSEGTDVGKGRALPSSGQLAFHLDVAPSVPANQSPGIAPKRLTASMPFDQGGAVGHGMPKGYASGWGGAKVNPTSSDWDQAGRSQSKVEHETSMPTNVHEGQFQMFMTPREIRSKWQALDGDRQEAYDERAGELTNRSQTTGGGSNFTINTGRRKELARWHGGASQVEGYTHERTEGSEMETDDQLFARKLDEAQMDPVEYREVHGGETKEPPGWNTLAQRSDAPSEVKRQAAGNYSQRTGEGSNTWAERNDEAQDWVMQRQQEHEEDRDYGPSLHDRIRAEGVQKPVHLSYGQLGSYGKPEIVGGHHRLAVQHDIDPDQPIPVAHWQNIWEAKQSKTYS
jgi:hypothetical protein